MSSQSRMMRGRYSNRTRGRKARREGGGYQDNPRDEKSVRSVLGYDEKIERVSLSTTISLRPRGGGHNTSMSKGGSLFFSMSTPNTPSESCGAPPRPRRGKEFAEGGLAEGVTSQSAERFIAPRVFSVSIGQNADFGALERGFYCLAGSRQARAEPRVTVEV